VEDDFADRRRASFPNAACLNGLIKSRSLRNGRPCNGSSPNNISCGPKPSRRQHSIRTAKSDVHRGLPPAPAPRRPPLHGPRIAFDLLIQAMRSRICSPPVASSGCAPGNSFLQRFLASRRPGEAPGPSDCPEPASPATALQCVTRRGNPATRCVPSPDDDVVRYAHVHEPAEMWSLSTAFLLPAVLNAPSVEYPADCGDSESLYHEVPRPGISLYLPHTPPSQGPAGTRGRPHATALWVSKGMPYQSRRAL